MAREKIKCPGCDCKVSLSEIEKNDGACPECGQQVFGVTSKLFDDYSEERNEPDLEDQDENGDLEDDNENYDFEENDDDLGLLGEDEGDDDEI